MFAFQDASSLRFGSEMNIPGTTTQTESSSESEDSLELVVIEEDTVSYVRVDLHFDLISQQS